jgi:UDP-N-acetylmuramoyl-L-alanyl-D-glutamate--2,6-diaminopimelate ligase
MNAANAGMTSLDELLAGLAAAPPVKVAGLKLDGRKVRPGEAFVAVRGLRRHGLDFVSQALEHGARAVLFDPAEATAPALPEGVVAVAVPALAARLGEIADRCYGSPSARLSIAGVTGTNGKTTCAWLLASAASALGSKTAYVGTLGAGFPPDVEATTHTTPDVLGVHRILADVVAAGGVRAAMEVSSHALDQDRLAGVRLEIAAFTNLTRDHLDYHGTLEAYAAAKQRLFAAPGLAHAVINVGDPVGREFAAALPPGIELTAVSVGSQPAVVAARTVTVGAVQPSMDGIELSVQGDFGQRTLRSALIGDFNAENLAVVLGVLLAWGHPVDAALAALAAAPPPPGRMEAFPVAGGALAIVDYAHTPDALAKVLEAARRHASGRLRVVFGCGGERDTGKRALMGGIAERLADEVFVTDDNPRGEDPRQIVEMILSGMATPSRARVIHGREAAIAAALDGASDGDIVVVAGKGHERQQVLGAEVREYSDRDCVSRLAGRAA